MFDCLIKLVQSMFDCLSASFQRAFAGTNVENECVDLLLSFISPHQDLHNVAKSLLVSFIPSS
jgi:hypothetical protein